MRCKIDGGMLESLGQEGYVEKWKCRRCKVIWELRPMADFDTDEKVITGMLKQKLREYEIDKAFMEHNHG